MCATANAIGPGSREAPNVYTERDLPMMRECFDRDLAPLIADKLAKKEAELGRTTRGASSAAQPKIDTFFANQRQSQ